MQMLGEITARYKYSFDYPSIATISSVDAVILVLRTLKELPVPVELNIAN